MLSKSLAYLIWAMLESQMSMGKIGQVTRASSSIGEATFHRYNLLLFRPSPICPWGLPEVGCSHSNSQVSTQ